MFKKYIGTVKNVNLYRTGNRFDLICIGVIVRRDIPNKKKKKKTVYRNSSSDFRPTRDRWDIEWNIYFFFDIDGYKCNRVIFQIVFVYSCNCRVPLSARLSYPFGLRIINRLTSNYHYTGRRPTTTYR